MNKYWAYPDIDPVLNPGIKFIMTRITSLHSISVGVRKILFNREWGHSNDSSAIKKFRKKKKKKKKSLGTPVVPMVVHSKEDVLESFECNS